MEKNDKVFKAADAALREQILDQIPSIVMAVDKDFRVTYMNEAGKKLLGKREEEILGCKCCDVANSTHCNTSSCCMKKAIENEKPFSDRTESNVNGRKVPVEYYAVPLYNEEHKVIGGLEFAVDITEQIVYEERLREQSRTIREMSTPTIKLWEGVLVLPVVGVIDTMRAQHMMESMLTKIGETYSKVIILDIQGVAAVDTAVANHLIKITKATKLMGCECILSGISPAVAQTIIQLGIDMESIRTKSTLSDALAEALVMLGVEVKQ